MSILHLENQDITFRNQNSKMDNEVFILRSVFRNVHIIKSLIFDEETNNIRPKQLRLTT